MRVGLLTQWFDPEPGPAALPGVLARGLAAKGHEVRVLTGFPNYPTGQLADGYRIRRHAVERTDGVEVHRVALYANHDSSAVKRMLNYGSFGLSAMVNGASALRGLDALWVNYSPITVAGAQFLARGAFGVPSVVHVLDLWPDTLFAGGFAREGRLSRSVERGLSVWCSAMYRAASSVAYISPGAGRVLEQRGVPAERLHYVPMWADEAVFRPSNEDMRPELQIPSNAVVLLYAGAMGDAQGLESLIDACELADDPRFVCVLAGSGITESRLRQRAASVDNVRFVGRVPQSSMTRLMATGDLNYVGLRPHALSPITMPSKTQAALAAGRPLLVAAQGDVAHFVDEAGIGFVADPASSQSIAEAIKQALALGRDGLAVLGQKARATYDESFSAAEGVSRIERLLQIAAVSRKDRE